MKIIIHSFSTIGRRSTNEDALEVVNNLDNSNSELKPYLFCGVFDGHGGDKVSKTLVDPNLINISKYFLYKKSPIAETISPTDKYNNKQIVPLFNRIQEKLKNYHICSNKMGSTSLISIVYPKMNDKYYLKIINLGDCRAVGCNYYNIGYQLSLDHKPINYCEYDRIIKSGGVITKDDDDDYRIDGMSVSRSFGDLDNKYVCQTPDIFDYLLNDYKFLILACDGVWDVLSNQDCIDFILKKKDGIKILDNLKGRSENNIAMKLAEYALDKGSEDNLSIIIIFIDES
jgi:serine/threonine protein phosphatase PrpC